MSLVRYQPWNTVDQFRREMDRFFNQRSENDSNVVSSDWLPAVDIKETENAYELHADLPGIEPENIDVHAENGVLTIKGERNSEKKDETADYKRVERSYGSFYRRFTLPETADADKIEAKCKHGVLEIVIPKQAKAQPRKITVQQ